MKNMLCIVGLAVTGQALALPADAVELASGVLTVDARATREADIDLGTPGKQVNVGAYYSPSMNAKGILVYARTPAGAAADEVYSSSDTTKARVDFGSLSADFVDGRVVVQGLKQAAAGQPFLRNVWASPKLGGTALVQSALLYPGESSPIGTGEKVAGAIEIPAGEGNDERFFSGPYLKRSGYRGVADFPAALPFPIKTSFRVDAYLGQYWWDDIGWPGEVYEVTTNDSQLESSGRSWMLATSDEDAFRNLSGYFAVEGTLYMIGEATGGRDPFFNSALAPRPAYLVVDWDFANGPTNRMIVVDKG